MDTYLQKLQQTELKMLKEVVAACDKLKLHYVLSFGTLLGAVRHGGFIPWDDDIDIGMPREDYDRFIREAQPYLPSHLFIQHYTTEPHTNCTWAKVRNTNTVFLENDNRDCDINHGIFIDIFPYDRCKADRRSNYREYQRQKRFRMVIGCYSNAYIASILSPLKRLAARMIRLFIIRGRPIVRLMEREENRRRRANAQGDDCYLVGPLSYLGTMSSQSLFGERKILFEDTLFSCPADTEEYLIQAYGDYMQLPPEDRRITHKPLKVVFEDGSSPGQTLS